MSVDEDGALVTIPTPTGARHGRSVDAVFVIDDSGSTATTDPKNHRYVAARRLAYFIAEQASVKARRAARSRRRRRAPTGFDDQIGIVHFADSAGPILLLTPVGTRLDTIVQALKPATGGGTSIVSGVVAAVSLVNRSTDPVTIVWTDGDIGESDAEITAALRLHRPDTVHLIVFSEGGLHPDRVQRWASLPFASVTAVDSMGTTGIEWAYSKPIVEAMGYTWSGPTRPDSPHTPIRRRRGIRP